VAWGTFVGAGSGGQTLSALPDLQTVLFWTVAIVTGVSAIAVVVTQNIVRSAAWLLVTLGGTAGIYFLLGADFVGATQLIIYVGGILVLVVFGVMLTAQGPFISMKVGAAEWAIALVVGIVLFVVLATTTMQTDWPTTTEARMNDAANSMNSATLAGAFLGLPQVTPKTRLSISTNVVPTAPVRTPVAYLLPFEIVSVHLLVVLIGAAYLARAKRRRGPTL
jgi:NADH-quinone oxidoreductase subunit J